nr:prepilin peptidase [Acidithiobacillus caldus]
MVGSFLNVVAYRLPAVTGSVLGKTSRS